MTSGTHQAGTPGVGHGARMDLRGGRWLSALPVVCALVLIGCGGSSQKPAPATSGAGLTDADAQAVGNASLALDVSARTTSKIASDPQGMAKALQLLRALTVTQTLGVSADSTVGGQLASNLFGELDGILPGALATGVGSAERLNAPVVRRFQRYARSKPALVEEPKVRQAVGQLRRLLDGKPANTRVTLVGQDPARTARQELARGVQAMRQFWPGLSAQLSKLEARPLILAKRTRRE